MVILLISRATRRSRKIRDQRKERNCHVDTCRTVNSAKSELHVLFTSFNSTRNYCADLSITQNILTNEGILEGVVLKSCAYIEVVSCLCSTIICNFDNWLNNPLPGLHIIWVNFAEFLGNESEHLRADVLRVWFMVLVLEYVHLVLSSAP